ncbi:MAG: YcaO-like family protein [Deltaproteobacteria bacterium]|nr:YcaO-like family protein [Deltaproteobacteria bacterium]MBW2052911.1 YcaO-like family protein [Deltaproteobacteria bacterium]MBW2141547.1 YcaO-like family protein [Deltaproteobacteria bacterium]MBW2323383.1 YcaO-like family protein [Deltaproteobacteria bacterium]
MSSKIHLQDCFKTYTLDQDKAFSPEETVLRVKDKLAKANINILENTKRIDNGRLDIPVYLSILGPDALQVMPTKKQMGKGATPAQAEASAVMELIERYSFFHFVHHEPFISGTYDELKDQAMPFEHLAASVHHDPNDLDRARQAVSGLKLSWTPAYNLTQGQEYLVPFNWFYEINEFNGPAAGNSMEETLAQGMCELVERHVSALICRNKTILPFIDTASLESPVAKELVQKFERQGIKIYIKDFTLDMGVPSVGALAYDPATFPLLSEIVYTAGTASDPEKAFIRTLTEVAQLAGDFNSASTFVASGLPKYTDLSQAEYLTDAGPSVPISSLPNINHNNIKVEVERIVAALAKRGLEVYVINTTHPDLDIPAVYTIVPGAHFRERARASSVPFFAAKIISFENNLHHVTSELDRIRKLYPESYFVEFFQGEALLSQGRPEEAIDYLKKALALEPLDQDLSGILTYIGLAYKEMEDFKLAISYLERSAALDDERQDTFNLLGFCFFKIKQHEKSIKAFKKVLEIDPGSGIDHANIGSNYRELGKTSKAVEYYKTALKLDPTLDWVRENLAKLT